MAGGRKATQIWTIDGIAIVSANPRPRQALGLRDFETQTTPAMMHLFRKRTYIVLFVLAVISALSACAQNPVASKSVRAATGGEGAVFWQTPEFTDAVSQRLIYDGVWQREEYLGLEAPAARAELLLATANPYKRVVLNFELGLRRSVKTWAFNQNHLLQWSDAGDRRVEHRSLTYFYEAYRLPEAGLACFALSSSWNPKLDDQRVRPADAIFGYYCEPGVAQLTDQLVADLIERIAIYRVDRRRDRWVVWRGRDRVVDDPPAAAAVPDQVPMLDANPSFPFRFARNYQIGGRDYE